MSLSFIATHNLFIALDPDTAPQLSETTSAETINFWPLIDIVADDQGDFGGRTAVEDNRIIELPPDLEPEFLVEFKDKLTRRRLVESDTV